MGRKGTVDVRPRCAGVYERCIWNGLPVRRDAGCVLLSANQLPYVPGACQEPVGVFLLGAVDCVQADDVVPSQTIVWCKSHAHSEALGMLWRLGQCKRTMLSLAYHR